MKNDGEEFPATKSRVSVQQGIYRAMACLALSAITAVYFVRNGVGMRRSILVAGLLLAGFLLIWLAEWRLCGPAEPPPPKKPGFDWGMHYMRGFAIVCILLTHFFGRTGWVKFSQAFLTSSTIFFLFISGYLCQFLALRRPVVTRQYYLAKLKNVFLPYLVFSFGTMVAALSFPANRPWVVSHKEMTLLNLPNILLLGWAQRQYWYIPFVALLFLISPWLTRVRNRTLVWLAVVSFFLFICFPHRPQTRLTWSFSDAFYRYAHFTWGYLIGFVYARWKKQIDPYLRDYAVPALLLGLILGLHSLEMLKFGDTPPHILRGAFARSMQKLFFIVPVLCVVNRLRSTRIALFDALATYSFTLFFLHYFFVQDYVVLQSRLFAALGLGSTGFAVSCVRLALAAVFIAQNLLLAILLKKATGRWSRSFTGA